MEWLTKDSRNFLNGGYLLEGETAESRIKDIAEKAEEILGQKGFAKKFYSYMEKGFFSLSTPVWTNFGRERGLPVSCFGSYIEDNTGSICSTNSEVAMMTKFGGGTSIYFGNLRPRGSIIKNNGHSSGSVHFMELFEKTVEIISQGSTRRGNCAGFLPIEHKDIKEFLGIRTEGHPVQILHFGVTVSDQWMKDMIEGDKEKRKTWAQVLKTRSETGEPYILFSDTANRNTVDVYKEKKKKIFATNLCSEIMLPSNEDWSFVCCLSSINLLHYNEWKDTDAVETLTYFLDAVVTDFINSLNKYKFSDEKEKRDIFSFMERSYNFAKENRALGLGALGWHSFLQSKMIPFESPEAMSLNIEIFKFIKEKSYFASKEMAEKFGEPKALEGYGRRNATLNAVAPTTSSSFILGQVSQSIEPLMSNYYVKDLAKIKVTIKNSFLEKLLKKKGKNTPEIWKKIIEDDGSVQKLDFLSSEEKDVFKTFCEINQNSVVAQAAARQNYIDQGQSLNLMIHPDTPVKDINNLYIQAWKSGIKSLYYQHSVNAAQEFNRKLIDCNSCEG